MKTNVYSFMDTFSVEPTKRIKNVRSLDPLCAEEKLKMLPILSQQEDVKGLVRLLSSILPSIREIFSYDYYQAKAAMRDIHLLLDALKRHAFQPEDQVPELTIKLKYLSEKTNLPPRGTSLNYSF